MGPSPPGVESTGGTGADAGLLSDMKETIMCIKRHIELSPWLKSSDTTDFNKELTTGQKAFVQRLNSFLNRKEPQSGGYNYLALDIEYMDELHTKQLRFLEQAREEECSRNRQIQEQQEEECIRNRQIQEQQEEIARLQNRVETYEIERRKYFAEQTAAQTAVRAVDEWIKVGGMD
jgi:hypothetical protein